MSILEFAKEYLAAGIKCMPVELRIKKPRNSAWSTKWLDFKAFESTYHPGDGIGIVTGKESGVICIDIDHKEGRSALGWYEANVEMLGTPLVERTPSGGLHLYYKYPKGHDFLKSNKDKIYNGVEFMADGGRYVITAPSSHYVMHNDIRLTDLQHEGCEPPTWILDQVVDTYQKSLCEPSFEADVAADTTRCIEYITHMNAAVSGQGGDIHTFRAACRCRDYGLTQSQALSVLLEHFNPRCVPPWDSFELKAKIKNAYKYNKSALGVLVSDPVKEFSVEKVKTSAPPSKKEEGFITTNALSFVKKDFPPKEHIIGPFVKQGLSMVFAAPGVGKTYFALGLSYAIATGGEFLRWKCEKKQSVIYFDGELPAFLLKGRLLDLMRLNPCKEIDLNVVTPDEQVGAMPDFSTIEGQKAALKAIGDSQFVVIDNLSTLCRTGDENEAGSWLPMQSFLLLLRRLGKSVLLVHHTGKGENPTPRGTSKKEDMLDLIIGLKHPVGYKATDACSFQTWFRKARHYRNREDVEELKASYNDFGWTIETLEKSNIEKILELAADGWKQKDISESLDVDKGYVSRILKTRKIEEVDDLF